MFYIKLYTGYCIIFTLFNEIIFITIMFKMFE